MFGLRSAADVKVWPRFGVHASRMGSFVDVYCKVTALANPKYEMARPALPYLLAKTTMTPAFSLGSHGSITINIGWWIYCPDLN